MAGVAAQYLGVNPTHNPTTVMTELESLSTPMSSAFGVGGSPRSLLYSYAPSFLPPLPESATSWYDLTLTPEDLRDSLPEEILGPEHEVDQLNYIRDKCVAPSAPCRRRVLIVCACWCWNSLRMAGPSDCRRVELIPAQGESLNVLLRDRRIVRSWGWSAASEAVDNARAHARRLAARWHTSRSACANAMVSW